MGQIQAVYCRYCKRRTSFRYRRSRCCLACRSRHTVRTQVARHQTRWLIANGFLTKPDSGRCQHCQSDEYPLQAHHLSYQVFDRIQWLCPGCHTRSHEPARG